MNVDFSTLELGEQNSVKNHNLSIIIAGDWAPISGETSKFLIEEKKEYYGDIAPFFDHCDLSVINLETVIGVDDNAKTKYGRKFIDTKNVLGSLSSIDVGLACLANNHIMDSGSAGLKSTIDALNERDISHIGAGFDREDIYRPYLLQKGDAKVAIINVADGELANEKYNYGVGSADVESYHIIDRIRQCKSDGYQIVLIVHAGIEFLPIPAPFIQQMYRNFIDEGVNLIVGHHPHIVQGVEIYKEKAIFYSLGHFSLYRKCSRQQEKIGALLKVDVDDSIFIIKIVPFLIDKKKITLLKDDVLEDFISRFKMLSEFVMDEISMQEIWHYYVQSRYPIVDYQRIANLYKYDFVKSKLLMKTICSSLKVRYVLRTYCENKEIDKQKYASLFEEYKLNRKLTIMQKLFLLSRNNYNFLAYIKSTVVGKLIAIRKEFFK